MLPKGPCIINLWYSTQFCNIVFLMRVPNFIWLGKASFVFYYTRHPAYILRINPYIITGWLSIPFFNMLSWISVRNFIRLGQVVFVLYYTDHPAYITYKSLYCNWLIFHPILQFGIRNECTKFHPVRFSSFWVILLTNQLTYYPIKNYRGLGPNYRGKRWAYVHFKGGAADHPIIYR